MRAIAERYGVGTPEFRNAAQQLAEKSVARDINFGKALEMKRFMDRHHSLWEQAGGTVYEIADLIGLDSADAAKSFYIHFGPEAGYGLEQYAPMFFDGVYLFESWRKGESGYMANFVCQDTYPRPFNYGEAVVSAARFVSGWVPSGSKVSAALRDVEIHGDQTLVNDPTFLRMIDVVGDDIDPFVAARGKLSTKPCIFR
jgi:hypothetical protein